MPSLAARLAPLGAARIFLYSKNVDMRKSFDGLHAIIQAEFDRDALGGDLFVFLNRRRDRLKLMVWEPDGWAMFYKRLERGTFERPGSADNGVSLELDATDLALLLAGVELEERQTSAALPAPGAAGAPQLAGN